MAVELLNRRLTWILTVDDEAQSRKGYGYTIEDADLEPLSENGPLGELEDYLSSNPAKGRADAALCDFNLSTRSYASFSGAQLVARWYQDNFPALLCTRYEKVQIEHIRPYRRWIPILIPPNDLTVESLLHGLEECIFELSGKFRPHRRPWRTQVHFLSQDEDQVDTFFAEIPGWELTDIIRVRLQNLPPELSKRVGEDYRCHARANLGAESVEDLYLFDWEIN